MFKLDNMFSERMYVVSTYFYFTVCLLILLQHEPDRKQSCYLMLLSKDTSPR